MTLVLVHWRDAQDHADKWVDEDDAKSFGEAECIIESVGFLVSRTSKYVTIAGDWDEADKDYGRVTKIPTSMLISLVELAPCLENSSS